MVVTNNVESDVLDTTAQSRKLNASFFIKTDLFDLSQNRCWYMYFLTDTSPK